MENEIKWTPAQLDAISAKANKILVSAAAGSGKSTVLTKRIIEAVTNPEHPYDLDRLMVVTYTRASADDLKNKITDAIRNGVLEDPTNKHLADQLLKLPSAKINTIHGVCYSLVKSHFDTLGIPASVTIADSTTTTSLRVDVMSKLLNKCFAGEFKPIPDFSAFAENFITERDDALTSLLLSIYDKMKNDPDGISFKTVDNYGCGKKDFIKTPFGKIITDRMRMLIDYNRYMIDEAEKYFSSDEHYAPQIDFFETERRYAELIDNALKLEDSNVLRSVLCNPPSGKSPSIKTSDKTPEGERFRTERKSFREKINALASAIFNFTEDEIEQTATETKDIAEKLIAILIEYDKMLSEAKLKRSIIDFNDIEHYTLKLLYDPDGRVSKLAYDISSSLDEIYVDEYQDLNPLQNKIFNALSVSCPIFMVGDIKQSIYGFRGADSSAFANYKKTFPLYKKGSENDTATVFLSDNFRSAKPITEFSNVISDAMFYTPENDGFFDYRIPYSKEDRLNCGKKCDGTPAKVTIMNCIRDMTDEDVKKKDTYYVEANMVANEISRLIKNGVAPESIAILLRSAKTTAPVFADALKNRNIAVSTSKGAPLFETPEVQLALCLLNCCDNPYRDIFLAGALRSPVFGFTLDEMIMIRRENKDASSLFEALCEYTERYAFEKGKRFLEFLDKMRKYAIKNTVDRLLWQMYIETSFFTHIYDKGTVSEPQASARRSNLLSLHEMAKSYVDCGQSGLFGFLERIRSLIENDESPSGAKDDGNAVQILTMHSSKGLEFEYCFVCATTHAFEVKDLNKAVIFDKDLGLAMRIKDKDRLSSTDTPFRLALSYKLENTMRDEDMRMLYVALTRAKTKLYVCSSVSDTERLDSEIDLLSRIKHPYTFIRQTNHIKWILSALKMPTELDPEYETVTFSQDEVFSQNASSVLPTNFNVNSAPLDKTEKERLYNEFRSILTFEYPHKYAVLLPSKLSVSRLYPEILDESVDIDLAGGGELELQPQTVIKPDNTSLMDVPSFMAGEKTASAADKGTATHVFMQFCSFEKLSDGIDEEILRLVDKRFILKEHAALIDKSAIMGFLRSDIYKEIKKANELNREYRFNIKLPASDFTSKTDLKEALEGEYIFVQGIIDCYFRDKNGNITLLDYKTDYVPKEIRGDKQKEDDFFINRHSRQLSYYNEALKRLTKQCVSRTVIFSFDLGRCIEIPIN